jgi:DNA-binding CsgD family transcriptional regulator
MVDTRQDLFALARSWQVDPEANRLYQQYYGAIDVWGQRGLAKPAGYVCNSEALCPLAELSGTEVYNDFMVRFGVEHGLFGVVENDGSRWASMSLYRHSSQCPFDASELDIVNFLTPHMQRAFKLHLQFSQLKANSDGFEKALDLLPLGIIFIGPKGKVVAMNCSATKILAERDGLLGKFDVLAAELTAESSLLAKAILQATLTSTGYGFAAGETVLVSRRVRPPLQISISPIRNSIIQTSKPICAVAFVHDPLRRQRPAQEVLRALYGLTPAECRVALLLVDGLAPRKIAEMVGVTENTVRSQIKSIFAKTGVKRQVELIRLLLNNLAFEINAAPTFSPARPA